MIKEQLTKAWRLFTKHGRRWRWALLPLGTLLFGNASFAGVEVHAKDSLTIRQGVYSSLYFVAEPVHTLENGLPIQYQFTESGATPPGMIFEVYPCNKPGQPPCQQKAASNGIYLDGTPNEPGSYTFVITVTSMDGTKTSQLFTVVVETSDKSK